MCFAGWDDNRQKHEEGLREADKQLHGKTERSCGFESARALSESANKRAARFYRASRLPLASISRIPTRDRCDNLRVRMAAVYFPVERSGQQCRCRRWSIEDHRRDEPRWVDWRIRNGRAPRKGNRPNDRR